MSESRDRLTMEKKYVLVFDFCSSTSIIDQLILEGHLEGWRNLLIDIKRFLQEERVAHVFDVYKFTGDGWILLFDEDFSPSNLFSFVDRLCDKYAVAYDKRIKKVLSTHIDKIGITFGLHYGDVIRFVMLGVREYIGRPLNIATRLQTSIKDNDPEPQGKILMSKLVYSKIKHYIPRTYKLWKVTRELKNVVGGSNYDAIKCEKR